MSSRVDICLLRLQLAELISSLFGFSFVALSLVPRVVAQLSFNMVFHENLVANAALFAKYRAACSCGALPAAPLVALSLAQPR